MKFIKKTSAPQEYVDYCNTYKGIFLTLRGIPKRELKKKLIEDQGYICCYCGAEISNDENTKIEHVKCQKRYAHLALNYTNMLASCDGGDKDREKKVRPKHNPHCDAKKGNNDIPISPLDEDVENLFTYYEDGSIKSGDERGKELIRILGLDAPFLVTQRKNALKSYKDFSLDELEKELNYVKELHDGKYESYCFVREQHLISLINDKKTA